jgi:GntR family transcriptional regulator, transcriptional repressor for pyruvate dehydrogenase complex
VSGQLATSILLLSGASELSVEELIEARSLLEVPAAGLAARRRTEQHLEALNHAVEIEYAVIEAQKPQQERLTYHQGLVDASENKLLAMLTRPIFTALHTQFISHPMSRKQLSVIAVEHRAINDCIARQDEEGAREAMTAHLKFLAHFYSEVPHGD